MDDPPELEAFQAAVHELRELRQLVEHLNRELRAGLAAAWMGIEQNRAEMNQEFDAVRAAIEQNRADMNRELDAVRAAMQEIRLNTTQLGNEFQEILAEHRAAQTTGNEWAGGEWQGAAWEGHQWRHQ